MSVHFYVFLWLTCLLVNIVHNAGTTWFVGNDTSADTFCDVTECSLRACVDASTNNDIIQFSEGIYNDSEIFEIYHSLEFVGENENVYLVGELSFLIDEVNVDLIFDGIKVYNDEYNALAFSRPSPFIISNCTGGTVTLKNMEFFNISNGIVHHSSTGKIEFDNVLIFGDGITEHANPLLNLSNCDNGVEMKYVTIQDHKGIESIIRIHDLSGDLEIIDCDFSNLHVVSSGSDIESFLKLTNTQPSSNVNITNTDFTNFFGSTSVGGPAVLAQAVSSSSSSSFIVQNCRFESIVAGDSHGLIEIEGYESVYISHSTIVGNLISSSTASNVGMISLKTIDTIYITDTNFNDNSIITTVGSSCGCLCVSDFSTVFFLNDTTFEGCVTSESSSGVGGLVVYNSGIASGMFYMNTVNVINSTGIQIYGIEGITIDNCVFDGIGEKKFDHVKNLEIGKIASNGQVTIINSDFQNISASSEDGAALDVNVGSNGVQIFLSDLTFSNCKGNMGGAVRVVGDHGSSQVVIVRAIFYRSISATSSFGGILIEGFGDVEISQSIFSEGHALGGSCGGMGVKNISGNLILSDTQFYGGFASSGSGCLCIEDVAGDVTMSSVGFESCIASTSSSGAFSVYGFSDSETGNLDMDSITVKNCSSENIDTEAGAVKISYIGTVTLSSSSFSDGSGSVKIGEFSNSLEIEDCIFTGLHAQNAEASVIIKPFNESLVTISSSNFTNNIALVGIGGLLVQGDGLMNWGDNTDLVMEKSVFVEGNIAVSGNYGGAFFQFLDTVDLSQTYFVSNKANSGSVGGIGVLNISTSFHAFQVWISNNSAMIDSIGGIQISNVPETILSEVSIDDNFAGTEIGGFCGSYMTTLDLSDVFVRNNVASTDSIGGLVVSNVLQTTFLNVQIEGNSAGTSIGGFSASYMDTLDVIDSFVSDNVASTDSIGGLVVSNVLDTFFSNVHIESNFAGTTIGGFLASDMTSLNITYSVIEGNVAETSIGGFSSSSIDTLYILESSISDNVATSDSIGGLVVSNILDTVFSNVHIDGNSAGTSFGGFSASSMDSLHILDSSINGNVANTTIGGFLASSIDTLHILDTSVSDNEATTDSIGGLVVSNINDTFFSNVHVEDNTAGSSIGGFLASDMTSLDITNSVIERNIAGTSIGGFSASSIDTLHILDSSISDNVASTTIGGFEAFDIFFLMTISNSNIERNTASTGSFGGIRISDVFSLIISDTTVHENEAGEICGGIQISTVFNNLHISSSFITSNVAKERFGGFHVTNMSSLNDDIYFESIEFLHNTAPEFAAFLIEDVEPDIYFTDIIASNCSSYHGFHSFAFEKVNTVTISSSSFEGFISDDDISSYTGGFEFNDCQELHFSDTIFRHLLSTNTSMLMSSINIHKIRGDVEITDCGFYGNENGVIRVEEIGGNLVISTSNFLSNSNGETIYVYNAHELEVFDVIIDGSISNDSVSGIFVDNVTSVHFRNISTTEIWSTNHVVDFGALLDLSKIDTLELESCIFFGSETNRENVFSNIKIDTISSCVITETEFRYISGSKEYEAIKIFNCKDVNITDSTFSENYGLKNIYVEVSSSSGGGNFFFKKNDVLNSESVGDCGGICVMNYTNTVFLENLIEGNSADLSFGGGFISSIIINSEFVNFDLNTIQDNQAIGGSVGGFEISGLFEQFIVTSNIFDSNTANSLGGLRLEGSKNSTLQFTDNWIESNNADVGDVGGCVLESFKEVGLYDCTFTLNTAEGDVGGLYIHNIYEKIDILDCLFSFCESKGSYGGVKIENDILNNNGSSNFLVVVDTVTVLSCQSSQQSVGGMGIKNVGGDIWIKDSVFQQNSAFQNYGNLLIEETDTMDLFNSIHRINLTNCDIEDGTSSSYAGLTIRSFYTVEFRNISSVMNLTCTADFLECNTTTITNLIEYRQGSYISIKDTQILRNLASESFGGISVINSQDLELIRVTITENSAEGDGSACGTLDTIIGDVELVDCVFFDNFGSEDNIDSSTNGFLITSIGGDLLLQNLMYFGNENERLIISDIIVFGDKLAYPTSSSIQSILIDHCQFFDNTAVNDISSLNVDIYQTVTIAPTEIIIRHSLFENNRVLEGNIGAFQVTGGYLLSFFNMTVKENYAAQDFGGGKVSDVNFVDLFDEVTFDNNEVGEVGAHLGIFNSQGVTITNTYFVNGLCGIDVGGLLISRSSSSSSDQTSGNVTISNVFFLNNVAMRRYSALSIFQGENLLIENLHVEGNLAMDGGYCVRLIMTYGTIEIRDSNITHNEAVMGNNAGISISSFEKSVIIENVTFWENIADFETSVVVHYGLGISGKSFLLRNCLFYGNVARDRGSGIWLYSVENTLVHDCLFLENTNQVVYLVPSTIDILDDSGSYTILMEATIRDCLFLNNTGNANGGAISVLSSARIQNNQFLGNKAHLGGAIFVESVGDNPFSVEDCVFEGNTAEKGGAIFTTGGIFTFRNCNFTKNVASDFAIVLLSSSETTASELVFHNNSGRCLAVENGEIFLSHSEFLSCFEGGVMIRFVSEKSYIHSSIITNCSSMENGGALYISETPNTYLGVTVLTTIQRFVIQDVELGPDNHAGMLGGNIYLSKTFIELDNVLLTRSTALYGPAIAFSSFMQSRAIIGNNVVIEEHESIYESGVIFDMSGAVLFDEMNNLTLSNCKDRDGTTIGLNPTNIDCYGTRPHHFVSGSWRGENEIVDGVVSDDWIIFDDEENTGIRLWSGRMFELQFSVSDDLNQYISRYPDFSCTIEFTSDPYNDPFSDDDDESFENINSTASTIDLEDHYRLEATSFDQGLFGQTSLSFNRLKVLETYEQELYRRDHPDEPSGVFIRIYSEFISEPLIIPVEFMPCRMGYVLKEELGAEYYRCESCEEGFYNVLNSSRDCFECPKFTSCPSSSPGVLISDENFWTHLDETTGFAKSYFCSTGKCLGGNKCSDNYDGELPFCSACKEGHSLWSGSCVECDRWNAGPLLIYTLVTIIFAFNLHVNSNNPESGIEIVYSFFGQMYGMLSRDLSYTMFLVPVLDVMFSFHMPVIGGTDNDMGFIKDIWNWFFSGCPFPRSSYVYLVIGTMEPVLFLAVIITLFLCCLPTYCTCGCCKGCIKFIRKFWRKFRGGIKNKIHPDHDEMLAHTKALDELEKGEEEVEKEKEEEMNLLMNKFVNFAFFSSSSQQKQYEDDDEKKIIEENIVISNNSKFSKFINMDNNEEEDITITPEKTTSSESSSDTDEDEEEGGGVMVEEITNSEDESSSSSSGTEESEEEEEQQQVQIPTLFNKFLMNSGTTQISEKEEEEVIDELFEDEETEGTETEELTTTKQEKYQPRKKKKKKSFCEKLCQFLVCKICCFPCNLVLDEIKGYYEVLVYPSAYTLTLMNFTLVVYQILLTRSFSFFSCMKLGDEWVVQNHSDIQCYTPVYNVWLVFFIFVFAFCLIYPFFLLSFLLLNHGVCEGGCCFENICCGRKKKTEDQLENSCVRKYMGTLFMNYKPHLYFWEPINLLRRFVLVTLFTMIPVFESPSMGNVLICIVLIICIFVQLLFRPFVQESDNILEAISLTCLLSVQLLKTSGVVQDYYMFSAIVTFLVFFPVMSLLTYFKFRNTLLETLEKVVYNLTIGCFYPSEKKKLKKLKKKNRKKRVKLEKLRLEKEMEYRNKEEERLMKILNTKSAREEQMKREKEEIKKRKEEEEEREEKDRKEEEERKRSDELQREGEERERLLILRDEEEEERKILETRRLESENERRRIEMKELQDEYVNLEIQRKKVLRRKVKEQKEELEKKKRMDDELRIEIERKRLENGKLFREKDEKVWLERLRMEYLRTQEMKEKMEKERMELEDKRVKSEISKRKKEQQFLKHQHTQLQNKQKLEEIRRVELEKERIEKLMEFYTNEIKKYEMQERMKFISSEKMKIEKQRIEEEMERRKKEEQEFLQNSNQNKMDEVKKEELKQKLKRKKALNEWKKLMAASELKPAAGAQKKEKEFVYKLDKSFSIDENNANNFSSTCLMAFQKLKCIVTGTRDGRIFVFSSKVGKKRLLCAGRFFDERLKVMDMLKLDDSTIMVCGGNQIRVISINSNRKKTHYSLKETKQFLDFYEPHQNVKCIVMLKSPNIFCSTDQFGNLVVFDIDAEINSQQTNIVTRIPKFGDNTILLAPKTKLDEKYSDDDLLTFVYSDKLKKIGLLDVLKPQKLRILYQKETSKKNKKQLLLLDKITDIHSYVVMLFKQKTEILVGGGESFFIYLWNARTSKIVRKLPCYNQPVSRFFVVEKKEIPYLISFENNGFTIIFDLKSGKLCMKKEILQLREKEEEEEGEEEGEGEKEKNIVMKVSFVKWYKKKKFQMICSLGTEIRCLKFKKVKNKVGKKDDDGRRRRRRRRRRREGSGDISDATSPGGSRAQSVVNSEEEEDDEDDEEDDDEEDEEDELGTASDSLATSVVNSSEDEEGDDDDDDNDDATNLLSVMDQIND